MKTILKVRVNPRYAVLSSVVLYYRQGNSYGFLEEHGTLENLCLKYEISRTQTNWYDCRHLVGRKCIVYVLNGQTTFKRYVDLE